MQKEECIIIGGGPCGLSAAIELQNIGKSPLVIEKGNCQCYLSLSNSSNIFQFK